MRVRWRRVLPWVLAPLLVAGLGVVAFVAWARWDAGRRPEVTDALGVLRRAVADAVTAAGPDVAVAIGPVLRSSVCRINALRDGGVFAAKADVYTDPGDEDAVITGIGAGLAGYPVRRGTAPSGVRPLEAGLAGGVQLAVRRLGPGWLTVSARTGCSRGTAPAADPAPAGGAGVAAATATFAALGTRPASVVQYRLDCPAGTPVTVAAVSEPADSSRLVRRLAAAVPQGAHRLVAGASNRLAYRAGPVSVIVAAADDGSTVTTQYTTSC